MSVLPLWGTGMSPIGSTYRRRATSDGDLRITSEGDIRIATVEAVRVAFLRTTSVGDQRVTSEGDRRIVVNGLLGPQYFQTSDVTSDGGESFAFTYTTNPWQPTAQGGEQLFSWAYVAVSWSMAATIRLSAWADGDDQNVDISGGGTIEAVRSTFQLEQQTGTLQRLSRVLPVPLVRRVVRNGVEVFRTAQRGERLQITLESTGPLGIGELMLEGIQVEYTPVRKSIYPVVDSTP